jgi:cytochrome c-type biogenesis protein
MDYANVALALFAGLFSILSPCVLPLVPIVLGAASPNTGLDPLRSPPDLERPSQPSGYLLRQSAIRSGSMANDRCGSVGRCGVCSHAAAPSNPARARRCAAGQLDPTEIWKSGNGRIARSIRRWIIARRRLESVRGPTLGAASVLAAQGRSLGLVALTMLFFGLGSAVPLIALGLISREAMMRARHRLLSTGTNGKTVLGGILIVSGLLILFDLDQALEAWFVRVAPSFLLDLSGRY